MGTGRHGHSPPVSSQHSVAVTDTPTHSHHGYTDRRHLGHIRGGVLVGWRSKDFNASKMEALSC